MKSLNDRIKAATTMTEVSDLVKEGETYEYRSNSTRSRNIRLAAEKGRELTPVGKPGTVPVIHVREEKKA